MRRNKKKKKEKKRSLHLKCSPVCFGLRCLFDLDPGIVCWVSPAKDWLEMECCRMSVVLGFVYKMNRMDPRLEPCRMPKLSKVGCESLLLAVTVSVLLEK